MTTTTPRTDLVESLIKRYPHIPKEAIVKEDLLRAGVCFTEGALEIAAAHQNKSYFIFSFDLTPFEKMEGKEYRKAPEELCLEGGPLGFRRTIVSVRLNPRSPYRVVEDGGACVLELEGTQLCGVGFRAQPAYYAKRLANGKPLIEVAPNIEWGYLIYLTVYRICQYFGKEEECKFCDMNENYRQQIQAGRPYTAVKSVDDVVEAMGIIAESDTDSKAYTITGGSVTSQLAGLSEVDFYARYAEAIESRYAGRWISKMVVQALPKEEARKFKDAGTRIYHPNFEIWDAEKFSAICPGKNRYVGRDEWIKRILDATDIFGAANVIPNFVGGIEMAKPYGFTSVDEAIASTRQGLEFFMSKGVTPRFTTWCPEPNTELGEANPEGAPLEYHVRLLEAWRDTQAKYKLAAPPGYGDPGSGRAVFSVSAFMDVAHANAPE
jgi:hypothetical protein